MVWRTASLHCRPTPCNIIIRFLFGKVKNITVLFNDFHALYPFRKLEILFNTSKTDFSLMPGFVIGGIPEKPLRPDFGHKKSRISPTCIDSSLFSFLPTHPVYNGFCFCNLYLTDISSRTTG